MVRGRRARFFAMGGFTFCKKCTLKAHVTLWRTPRKKALSHTPSSLRALRPVRAMEGRSGTSSAPAPPRRSTGCHCVMRSGSSPSTAPANAVAAAHPQSPSDVERRLDILVHEVEELAPLLSEAVLRGAAERMQALLHGTRLREAMTSESPLQPEHLSFAAAGGARNICEDEDGAADGNDGDSVGSLADREVPAAEREEDQEREEHEQVRVHIDPRAPAALDNGIVDEDAFLPDWLRPREFAGFEVEAAEYTAGEADEADGGREPRMGSWARDDVGLAQDGRRMYCDYHDLRGTCPHACMAADMLQQSRIAALVQKHQRLRARRPQKDPDGREARHELYKAVIAWQWANPLGAENRVRLPRCVEHCVRRLFPNPICGEGCDYSEACEQCGHYTGFRTTAQSRAVREGAFLEVEQ